MKDTGTEELQQRISERVQWQGGVDYLFERGVIDQRQCVLGRAFAGWCKAFHSRHNVRCSLGDLVVSEGAQDGAENRLLEVMAAEDWFAKVSDELFRRGHRDGIPFARIVLMVCAYGWGCADVQRDCRIRKATSTKWVRLAFAELVNVVDMLCESNRQEGAKLARTAAKWGEDRQG